MDHPHKRRVSWEADNPRGLGRVGGRHQSSHLGKSTVTQLNCHTKDVWAVYQVCQRRRDCWRSEEEWLKEAKGDKSILFLSFFCVWTWISEHEQLPLQRVQRKSLFHRKTVLVRSEVAGPLNKEARNAEEFWLGHSRPPCLQSKFKSLKVIEVLHDMTLSSGALVNV